MRSDFKEKDGEKVEDLKKGSVKSENGEQTKEQDEDAENEDEIENEIKELRKENVLVWLMQQVHKVTKQERSV